MCNDEAVEPAQRRVWSGIAGPRLERHGILTALTNNKIKTYDSENAACFVTIK